jgi:FMN phosphatase YigB (HAD superfamily)
VVGNVNMKKIKNVIFDLGGVIINLDIPRTIKAFEAFGINDFEKTYSQLSQTAIFDQFDKGTISEEDFFRALRLQFDLDVSIADLKNAWNAMLLDFPKHRLEQLKYYKSNYRTFLLSNTNFTHIQVFEQTLLNEHGVSNLSGYFEKDYYSCRMGMRKPDKAIFEFVLNENQLDPEETVFIDDTIIHVNGAKQAGINAYLLTKGAEFKELLDTVL